MRAGNPFLPFSALSSFCICAYVRACMCVWVFGNGGGLHSVIMVVPGWCLSVMTINLTLLKFSDSRCVLFCIFFSPYPAAFDWQDSCSTSDLPHVPVTRCSLLAGWIWEGQKHIFHLASITSLECTKIIRFYLALVMDKSSLNAAYFSVPSNPSGGEINLLIRQLDVLDIKDDHVPASRCLMGSLGVRITCDFGPVCVHWHGLRLSDRKSWGSTPDWDQGGHAGFESQPVKEGKVHINFYIYMFFSPLFMVLHCFVPYPGHFSNNKSLDMLWMG